MILHYNIYADSNIRELSEILFYGSKCYLIVCILCQKYDSTIKFIRKNILTQNDKRKLYNIKNRRTKLNTLQSEFPMS